MTRKRQQKPLCNCKQCGKPFEGSRSSCFLCSKECVKLWDAKSKRRRNLTKRLLAPPPDCLLCNNPLVGCPRQSCYCFKCYKSRRAEWNRKGQLKWRVAHLKISREKSAARARAWYKSHPEKAKQNRAEWNNKNRDKRQSYHREYDQARRRGQDELKLVKLATDLLGIADGTTHATTEESSNG